MQTVNLVEAKAHLSQLVRIMKRGKVVAQINSVVRERKPINLNVLRALTDNMTRQTVSASESVRAMRDEDRY